MEAEEVTRAAARTAADDPEPPVGGAAAAFCNHSGSGGGGSGGGGGHHRSRGRSGMACSANHSKGSGSGLGHGLIVGQPAWLQRKIHLRPQHRGVHLVTEEILRQVCTVHSSSITMPNFN